MSAPNRNTKQNHHPDREIQINKFRWLMFSRVAIISFFLGITGFFEIADNFSGKNDYQPYFYGIIILTYALSLIYLILLKRIESLKQNVFIQALCDVFLITALVLVTGASESVYSILYPLVIIYSVLFTGRQGSLVITTVAGILYSVLMLFDQYGLIHGYSPNITLQFEMRPFTLYSRIAVNIVFYYLIAILTSLAVEKEKKVSQLLADRVDAFNQLDQLHRSIIESIDAGIMTVDLQGYVKSFNRAAEEITGFQLYEVENRRIDDLFPEIANLVKGMEDEPGDAVRRRFEINVYRKSGEKMILGFSVSALYNRERNIGNVIIFKDVTLLKEIDEKAERNKRFVLIGEMAAGLAHELRNRLASISGSIQMLRKSLTLDSTDERLMQVIMRGKDQLENLVKNFLLLAKANLGERTEINLPSLLDEVIESIRHSPEWDGEIEIRKDYHGNPVIYGNATEIRQAFWNLILNAFQAMGNGGVLSITSGWVSGNGGEKQVMIGVSDNGSGIEKQYLDRIMEPFFTTKDTGTGLGLAIVNRIIMNHGGSIRVESEINKGTTFTVLLPHAKG
jgi:two-component system, NtrC family, sensor histidine kinase PilS